TILHPFVSGWVDPFDTVLRKLGVDLLHLIPTDASGKPNLFWEALQIWTDGAVKVFAMLAYIIRAMALRTSQRMVIIFVALAAATNLIYFWDNPFQIGHTWLRSVCQYSFLLGVSTLAAHVFQRKRPLLKTVIEETQ